MSIDTNHIKLNSNNFCYFAFNCRSEKLSNTDQKTATLATILLSLSLGIGHLLCYILLKHRKITPQPES